MYGGLGSLFRMQDAYSQRPGPITQEQSNEANRKLMEKYKAAAQQQAQQPAQQQAQQVVQQQYASPSAMWDGGQGG
jgi:putative NADH-flavin reductase